MCAAVIATVLPMPGTCTSRVHEDADRTSAGDADSSIVIASFRPTTDFSPTFLPGDRHPTRPAIV
jgi:hypothetical protein